MNDKENKRFMEDMDEARRSVMTEADKARHDDMDRVDGAVAAAYGHAETAEDKWRQYQMAMDKPARDALRRDEARYDAIARLFYSAGTEAEMDRYMGMSADQLFALATEKDIAALEAQEA